MTHDLDAQVLANLSDSRKYRHLCPDTLRRIAAWSVERHPSAAAATKAAKRKLHQVHGAYIDQLDLRRLERLVAALPPVAERAAFEVACRETLTCHASTAERLACLGEVYGSLFRLTGVPASLADLACGLHPFALPWMGLPPGTHYFACDIDSRIVGALGRLFECAQQPGAAECRDLLVSPPECEVDVALLLKTVPCLEQQEKGATLKLLRHLRARYVVLSFPTYSLGGKSKGMRQHYGRTAEGLAEALGVEMQRLDFGTETFFVLRVP